MNSEANETHAEDSCEKIVLRASATPPSSLPEVGFKFEERVLANPNNLDRKLCYAIGKAGLQASNMARAAASLRRAFSRIIEQRGKPIKVIIAFTSNMISSGLRDVFIWMISKRLVHIAITSAGGIEEDIIKALGGACVMGHWNWKGAELRSRGWNRIGNCFIPNDNYVALESWLEPIFERLAMDRLDYTPSMLVEELGRCLDKNVAFSSGKNITVDSQLCRSFVRECSIAGVPIFCPGIIDGALGDNLFFHSIHTNNTPLKIDLIADTEKLYGIMEKYAAEENEIFLLCLGGGVSMSQSMRACAVAGGAKYAIFIHTAPGVDGSLQGIPQESQRKLGYISDDCESISIWGDATIIFPRLVAAAMDNSYNGN